MQHSHFPAGSAPSVPAHHHKQQQLAQKRCHCSSARIGAVQSEEPITIHRVHVGPCVVMAHVNTAQVRSASSSRRLYADKCRNESPGCVSATEPVCSSSQHVDARGHEILSITTQCNQHPSRTQKQHAWRHSSHKHAAHSDSSHALKRGYPTHKHTRA